MTLDMFQKILQEVYVRGKTLEEITKTLNVSSSTIVQIKVCVEGFRTGNTHDIIERIKKTDRMSDGIIKCTSYYLDMPVPKEVRDAMEERKQARKAKAKERRAKGKKASSGQLGVEMTRELVSARDEVTEEAPADTQQEEPKPEPKLPANDALYFIRILEELHEQNELMRQMLDAVIPHYVADLKDCMNANADVIGKDVRDCLEELKAVRCNTRKRGL